MDKPIHLLRRWWVKKYRLPPTSDEFKRYTLEELWVEFYEDEFSENPDAMIDTSNAAEHVQFVTGDSDIDSIENSITQGASYEEIDAMLDSWVDEDPSAPEAPSSAAQSESDEVDLGDGFNDTF